MLAGDPRAARFRELDQCAAGRGTPAQPFLTFKVKVKVKYFLNYINNT